MKKTMIRETTQTVVDRETGEVIEETTSKTWTQERPTETFWMAYSKYMAACFELTSASVIKILWKLLDLAAYNTGEISLPPEVREKIQTELKISSSMFDKGIKQLKEKELIYGGRGFYQINPLVHWRGTIQQREKLLRSRLEITVKPTEDFSIEKEK